MIELDVSTKAGEMMFAPGSVVEEVIQNVRIIISTPKGSVPLDRDFGLDNSFLDKPLPIAKARMTQDVVDAVTRYEKRCKVVKVLFDDQALAIDGVLRPIVRIRING